MDACKSCRRHKLLHGDECIKLDATRLVKESDECVIRMERIIKIIKQKEKEMIEGKKKGNEEKERSAKCGNKCRDKCDLEKHVRKNHEFGGNECNEEFGCGDQLVEHIKTNHEA